MFLFCDLKLKLCLCIWIYYDEIMIFINLKDFLDNCKLCVCVYDEDVDFYWISLF